MAKTSNPLLIGLLGFVVGLIIGLPVLGWWLMPVDWTDTDFTKLRADLQKEYVVMVAGAFAAEGDVARAAARIQGLGPRAVDIMDATAQETAASPDGARVAQLNQAVQSYLNAQPAPAPAPAGNPWLMPLLGLLVVLVIGAVGAIFILRRGASPRAAPPKTTGRRVDTAPEPVTTAAGVVVPVPAAPENAVPVARFMTTYTLGDDVYDDSFSIDGPDGNFLGECGMGISETIGVGDPKKVTAFEVWLFDKNDIRTVTKVIMSEHGFRDEALKSRLAAKGEPAEAQPGSAVTLETQTLIVTARIVDMGYGGGALPPNSFFERLTIELQAYRKG